MNQRVTFRTSITVTMGEFLAKYKRNTVNSYVFLPQRNPKNTKKYFSSGLQWWGGWVPQPSTFWYSWNNFCKNSQQPQHKGKKSQTGTCHLTSVMARKKPPKIALLVLPSIPFFYLPSSADILPVEWSKDNVLATQIPYEAVTSLSCTTSIWAVLMWLYSIATEYNGPLEAAHAQIDDDRYDMIECGASDKPILDPWLDLSD